MGWLDQLGSGAIGALTGFRTGGLPGLVTGGVTSGLTGQKNLTLGSALQAGLTGAATGGVTKSLVGGLKKLGTALDARYAVQPPPQPAGPWASGYSGQMQGPYASNYSADFVGPIPQQDFGGYLGGKSIFTTTTDPAGPGMLEKIWGGVKSGAGRLGTGIKGIYEQGGVGFKDLSGLANAAKGLGGLGGLDKLGSILNRGGGGGGAPQQAPAQQQQAPAQQPQQQGGGGFGGQLQGRGGILGGGALDTLGLLGGGAMLGMGMSKNVPDVDMAGMYANAPADTQSRIAAAIADEQARRQAAEDIFTQQRTAGRTSLESELGAGTSDAMRRAIQTREQQLNAQGLLSGPSGALDYALADEAAKLRQANLNKILEYDALTQQGLSGMRQAGLEGELGLGRAGTERIFGLTDSQRNASLYQQLLAQAEAKAKQQQLIKAGGNLLGGGMNLPQGTLESIFGAVA